MLKKAKTQRIGTRVMAYFLTVAMLLSLVGAMPEPIWASENTLALDGAEVTWDLASADCEHPEALVKLYNIALKYDCGMSPDFDAKYHVGGSDELNFPEQSYRWAVVFTTTPVQNLEMHQGIMKHMNGDDSMMHNANVSGGVVAVEDYEADPVGQLGLYGTYIWCGPNSAFSVIDTYEKNDQRLLNLWVMTNTEGMTAYNATLNQMRNETIVNIITGAAELDTFDECVEQWYEMGGAQITEEVNTTLGR